MRLGWKSMLGCLFAVCCAVGSATPRAPASLVDYQHATWGQKEGAPAGIQVMARTSDGWLWVGTNAGLFEFDGLTFRRRETLAPDDLRAHSIRHLLATSSGDLWVFLSAGGASVLPHGDRDHPVKMTGLPDNASIDSSAEDIDGHVWASVGPKLYRSNGYRWEPVIFADVGLPETTEPHVVGDGRGNVWFAASDAIWVRVGRAARFTRVPGSWANLFDIAHAAGGRLMAIDHPDGSPERSQVLPLPEGSGPPKAYSESWTTMVDDHGATWSVACDAGELCVSGLADGSDPWKATGVPSPGTMTLLVDDEGSIWIGTKNGLERFRVAAARRVRFPPDTYFFAAIPSADGSVYVGTDSHNGTASDRLWHVDTTTTPMPVSPMHHPVSAWTRDTDGSILVAGYDGAWSFDGRNLQPVAESVPAPHPDMLPQALARDSRQRLWIAYNVGSPWRNGANGWQARGGVNGLPDGPVATIAKTDTGLWFGYRNNTLAFLDNDDRVKVFDRRAGLTTGSVNVVVTGPSMLVGGERGLQWFDGKAFHDLHALSAAQLTGVTGVLRDSDGALWVNGFSGLVHFAGGDVAHAMRDPSFAMPGRLYDDGDGLAGTAQQQRPLPTLARGSDGRIWVASTMGLAWLDPSVLPLNTRAPTVTIRDLDGQTQPVDGARVAADPLQVRIGFDVLSLTRPDRVEAGYRLVGSDRHWTEAGAHRGAVFGNLAPGTYRFEVMAANEDGVWNTKATSLTFTVEPTFFQTIWFKAICVLAALLAAWAIFVLRLRHERKLVRQKMAVRHAERERIARELHDSLLQGISGLLMRVQVWASRRDIPEDVQGDMARATDQGRLMLTQGRDRIAHLRADDAHPEPIAQNLRAVGEQLTALHGMRFVLADHAPGTTLRHDIAIEVCAIVQEAIANAGIHSRGSSVTVTLQRDGERLDIRVADDGRGIDAAAVEHAASTGHWGVVGMRERARRVEARLTIGAGTTGGTIVAIAGIRLTCPPPTSLG